MMSASDTAITQASESTSSPRRVLIYGINYAPEPIGVGRYTADIGSYLEKQGIQVDVVTAPPHYPDWAVAFGHRNRYSAEERGGIRITRCPLFLRAEMGGIWRLIAPLSFAFTSAPVAAVRIIGARPHTVLCVEPTLLCAPIAILCAKFVGARLVLHVQDLEIDAAFEVGHLRGSFFKAIANRLEAMILRQFDAIITISNGMRDRIAKKGISKNRIHLVRNWVDLAQLKPLAEKSPYRCELALSDKAFVALYAGSIGKKQALHVVLEAAARLIGEKELVFVVAGDGPEKQGLVRKYGHLPNVIFLPVQPEHRLCQLLNLGDVHLLPQISGSSDIVLPSKLGGMLASGKPSIVMADPGTELYEFMGTEAHILPPGDSVLLADALSEILKGQRLNRVHKDNALASHFDAKIQLPAVLAILKD